MRKRYSKPYICFRFVTKWFGFIFTVLGIAVFVAEALKSLGVSVGGIWMVLFGVGFVLFVVESVLSFPKDLARFEKEVGQKEGKV